jgi:hypothetical protein
MCEHSPPVAGSGNFFEAVAADDGGSAVVASVALGPADAWSLDGIPAERQATSIYSSQVCVLLIKG